MSSAVAARVNLILSFVGLFVAGMLSMSHILGIVLPCGIGAGCDLVTNDSRSQIFHVPIAYIGLVGYLAMAIITSLRLSASQRGAKTLHSLGYAMSAIGLAASIGLTTFSVREIHAVCTWCIASAVTMSLLFVVHALGANSADRVQPKGRYDRAILTTMIFIVVAGLAYSGLDLRLKEDAPTVADKTALEKVLDVDLIPPDAHVTGPKDAIGTVVMFGDLTCPACQQAYGRLQALLRGRSDFRLVFRHLPLEFHPMAHPAAVLSEMAAEKGKFWEFATAMYDQEPSTVDEIVALAGTLGVPPEEARKRMGQRSDITWKIVAKDQKQAEGLGLHTTPSLFVTAPGFYPEPTSTKAIPLMLDDIRKKLNDRSKAKGPRRRI